MCTGGLRLSTVNGNCEKIHRGIVGKKTDDKREPELRQSVPKGLVWGASASPRFH